MFKWTTCGVCFLEYEFYMVHNIIKECPRCGGMQSHWEMIKKKEKERERKERQGQERTSN